MQKQVMFGKTRAFLYASSITHLLLTLDLCANKKILSQLQWEACTGPNSIPPILHREFPQVVIWCGSQNNGLSKMFTP